MNKKALLSVNLLAIAISQTTCATESGAQEEPAVVLEKVIVTDKKPLAGTLTQTEMNQEETAKRHAQIQDTAKLLEDIPGVSLQAGGGVSSLPIIHGLNDDRVKIDVNGMTITSACANHMNPPLSYIDRTNVGTITVLQGVTPVSLGGDSIGGTIYVKSPEPVFAEPGKDILLNGRLSAFYRNNGDAFGGSIAAGVANHNARLEYTGSHSQSMNYNDGNGQIVKSTLYQYQNHAVSLAYQFDKHLLEFKGGQQHIPYQGFPSQRMDLTNNDSIFGNLHYKGIFDWGNLEGKLYLENTSHSMDIDYDKLNSNPPNTVGTLNGHPTSSHSPMPMDVRGRNIGYKIQAELPFNQRDTFRIGNEFHSNLLNEWWDPVSPYRDGPAPRSQAGGMWPNPFVNLNDASRDRLGTYAEWEANWSKEWRSMLGLRYDHTMADAGTVQGYHDPAYPIGFGGQPWADLAEAAAFNRLDHERNYDTFDVSALLQFTPDNLSQYEFGYARKNRAPSIYELYPWSTGSMAMSMMGSYNDGNGYVGNMDLKAETAHNISFSVAFHDPKNNAWEIKTTPYFTYVENFIDADRCTTCTQPTNGFYFLKYANHDARLWGFDLSARADFFQHRDLGQFAVRTIMSYVRGERMDGGNLYHMMPFNSKLSLDHKLNGWKSSVEMQFVDSKTDVQSIRNELTTPSYILLNAKTSYQWKNLSVDVGMDNVLDKQYYHPLSGVYAGDYYAMSISFPDRGFRNNRNLPGMGRSVFVGLTLSY